MRYTIEDIRNIVNALGFAPGSNPATNDRRATVMAAFLSNPNVIVVVPPNTTDYR